MSLKTIGLAAITMASLGAAVAHAELLANGGFENGNLQGWVATGSNTGGCDVNFNVSTSGAAAGCVDYAPISASFVAPRAGNYAVYASFDGPQPMSRTLTQAFSVPVEPVAATLSWSDAFGFGDGWTFPNPKTYTVSLLNGNGALVANLYEVKFSNEAGGLLQDWATHSADISSYLGSLAGQTAQIQFTLGIPDGYAGPGVFALDQVSIPVQAAIPEMDTGAMVLAGLIGLGYFAQRRRKVEAAADA